MISRNFLTKMIVALGVGGVFGWLTWSLLPENKQRSLEVLGSHAHSLLAVFNCLFISALVLSISFAYSRPDKTENTFDKRIAQFFFKSESDDKRLKLNSHIGVFLFAAVSALYIPVFLLWAIGFLSVPLGTSIEVWMKILLPIVGGIGGVFYLVLKYREQQNDERKLIFDEKESERQQKNFESEIATKKQELIVAEIKYADERKRLDESAKQEELNNAIRLLGDSSAQVRLAGVYALTDVADRYVDGYKQRVVDILCGYLRTDRSDQLVGGKFKDAAVESAIIKVIGEHLRKDREELEEKVQTLTDEQLWCDCSFDFRGATFTEPVLWEKTLWNKTADFSDSEFSKDLRFRWAKFAGDARFGGARFAGDAGFGGESFAGDSEFGGVSFAGSAWFIGASFAGSAWFGGVSFAGSAWFSEASFAGDAWFDGVRFDGDARFGRASFAGDAWFVGVRFDGEAWFIGASFAGDARFGGVRFDGVARFGGARFAGYAGFNRARFAGYAEFGGASFIGRFISAGITFGKILKTQELLLANPEAGTGFGGNCNIESYNDEWTLEKKTERLKEVYKRFYRALHDHPQKAEKLAGIQKTINKNFPDVTLEFKALEAEEENELEERRR